ncbi:hypothetical protein [Marinimicrococcus flavescens]|uniref:Uncharacterized protein n=1 Tax=Marinimicrococcus flavescens TaxID=3031815 RepID=A0AAP3V050_9PROT|nr:hypothetical protein [Marinimicrococcus flavescens]
MRAAASLDALRARVDGPWEAAASAGRYLFAPLAERRLPLRRISGLTPSGRPATVLVAGASRTIDLWLQRVMPHGRELVGLGTEGTMAAARGLGGPGIDMVLARVPRIYGRYLAADGQLRLPEVVAQRAATAEMRRRLLLSKSVRSSAGLSHAAGLGWREATEEGAFERFYAQMYRPFAERRFGEAAIVRERAALRRRLAKGGLLWIEQRGRIVGGVLIERDRGVLRLLSLGTVLDPQAARAAGFHVAVRLAGLDQAEACGLDVIDFGGTMPWLTDGILRSKHLWGAVLGHKRWLNRDILVRWERCTPAVADMLAAAPLILERPEGLVGVGALPGDGPASPAGAASLARRLHAAGLTAMTLIGPAGCEPGATTVGDLPVRLAPPLPSNALFA